MSAPTRHSLLALALVACQAVPPPNVPALPAHRVGEACRVVQTYPVSFATNAGGVVVALFAFAGGAASGRVTLPGAPSTYDASIADVRFGSYERSPLRCAVNPTFHFYCPTTRTVDQLCLVWTRVNDPSRVRGTVVRSAPEPQFQSMPWRPHHGAALPPGIRSPRARPSRRRAPIRRSA